MGTIAWTDTLAEARTRATDEKRHLLTYIFSPG